MSNKITKNLVIKERLSLLSELVKDMFYNGGKLSKDRAIDPRIESCVYDKDGEKKIKDLALLIGRCFGALHHIKEIGDLSHYYFAIMRTTDDEHWGIQHLSNVVLSTLDSEHRMNEWMAEDMQRSPRILDHHLDEYLTGAPTVTVTSENEKQVINAVWLAHNTLLRLPGYKIKADHISWLATALYNETEPCNGEDWLIGVDTTRELLRKIYSIVDFAWHERLELLKSKKQSVTAVINHTSMTVESTAEDFKFYIEPEENYHPYTYNIDDPAAASFYLARMAYILPIKPWFVQYTQDGEVLTYRIMALSERGARCKAGRIFSFRWLAVEDDGAVLSEAEWLAAKP